MKRDSQRAEAGEFQRVTAGTKRNRVRGHGVLLPEAFLRVNGKARGGRNSVRLGILPVHRYNTGMSDVDETLLKTLLAKAEAGDAEAQYELGWRHALGSALPLDDAEAVKWLKLAAANGHKLAQNNLGARCVSGEGVPRDLVEAWRWFHLAEQQGDRKAGKNRWSIEQEMTAEQLAQARAKGGVSPP